MDTLTAARVELAQPSPSVRHDFQTSLQVQNLIRQGEAALIALYKLTSHERGKQPSKASIQAVECDVRADQETLSCTQVVSNFCTAAASGLQLLFAGALAPDAITLTLCAETQRNVLRLLDLLHVTDCLKQSLCQDPPKAQPQQSAAGQQPKPAGSAAALLPQKGGDAAPNEATSVGSAGQSEELAASNVDEMASANGTSLGSSAPHSSAAGSDKGSSYPLGSLEVWGARWGALQLVCRKVAAVPNQQRISACLAVHAQQALSASNKGAILLLPEERLALQHSLPAALFILFSSEDSGAQALEAIGGPKVLMKCLQLLRSRTVVAAFGERPMSLLALLQASPYLSNLGAELGKEWLLISPEDLRGKLLAATEGSYCLSKAVGSVKAAHAALSSHLTSLAICMHELGARQKPIPLKVAAEAMALTEACLKSMSSWAQLLLDSYCWHTFWAQADPPGQETIRKQHSPEELGAMLEIMACLEGLAGQLLGEQAWLAQLLQQAVRAHAQHVADLLSAAIEKPSLPRKVLDAADAVRGAIIGWSGAALKEQRQPPEHRTSRLRGLAASVMRASRQRHSLLELAAGASSSTAQPHGMGEGIQYGVGAAGPTDLQRHMLVCALEALLKEAQPSGMSSLIRQGPLGDGLTKELHALHASTLHWPHLLEIPSSIKQASSMAPLGLKQCHVSAPSLSGIGSSATPLPGQLLHKALSSQNYCVPADYCLLPLVVYNDAATLCKERLSCEVMAIAAANAADAAFEELLDLLSDAVFDHAKNTAAVSICGLDDPGSSAAATCPANHFLALLRRPGVQLPSGAVSLRAGLVPKLTRLLASDVAGLVERLAGACVALPELVHQVQVLERAHRSLAVVLPLPPWSAIWTQPRPLQPDGSGAHQPMPYPGKITERATDAILQLITSEQCMFHSTHRCLTAEGMRQQPQQKVTAPQTSANSLPRVTDVVRGEEGSEKEADAAQGSGEHAESSSKGESREKGAAGSLHADTLGDAELAAFMRLTGPSGVAHLAAVLKEEACRCAKECYAALVHAACAVPEDVIGAAAADGPAELFAALTHALTDVAASKDAHRALCMLRCLGGALLTLLRLDASVSSRGVAQFLAAAPLLGIGPDERGALVQPDAGEVTPIAGSLFEACADLRLAHASASSDDAEALHTANALLQQAEEGCWQALEPPQLLPDFLEGLRRELAPILAHPPTLDNPSPIPLALSSLLFALGNPELGVSAPAEAATAEDAFLAASPILPSGSQSAAGSGELIGAVHSEAGLEGSWMALQSGSNTSNQAEVSEAGQTLHSQESRIIQDMAAMLNGRSTSAAEERSPKRHGDESTPAAPLCDGEAKRTGLSDGPPDQAAESGAESPTRPQAADRMDEAIQQGLELWTPPKSDEGPEWPEEPAGSLHEPSPTAEHLERALPSESLLADSPEVRPANGTEHTTAAADVAAATDKEHRGRRSTDGESAQALGSSKQDEVGTAGESLRGFGCKQVPEVNGSEVEPAGEQGSSGPGEQHSYRRKWNLKLPGRTAAASSSGAVGAKDAAVSVQDELGVPASDDATPRKSGFFGKRLARFSRSRGVSESASISNEVPSANGLPMPGVSPSQQLKGKEPAAVEQPCVVLNGSQGAAVEQLSALVNVRRSQSEAAAEARPGKRGFLKKQLTRFGRARGVSDYASAARDDASNCSDTGSQRGTSRLAPSRMLRWGDLGKSQAPKWPAEDLGESDDHKEEQKRLQWPMVGLAPLWGAALLVHLLQLQPHFQLQDLCRQLLLEADLTPPERSGSSASAASGVSQCLANLQSMQELMSEANLSLNAQILQSSPLDHQY